MKVMPLFLSPKRYFLTFKNITFLRRVPFKNVEKSVIDSKGGINSIDFKPSKMKLV